MAKSKPGSRKKQTTLSPQQLVDLRAFRHDLHVLKRKGLYAGDARKAKPRSALKKLVAENRAVIDGKERVSTVKKKAQKDALKREGFKVRRNKVITSKEYRVRNGKVFLAGKPGARIYTLDPSDPRKSLYAAWASLKPKYGLAIRINHHDGYHLYSSPEDMLNHLEYGMNYAGLLERYASKGTPLLEVFDPKESFEAYEKESAERRAEKLLAHADFSARKSKAKNKKPGRLEMLRSSFNSGLFD
jgi:hypothetical protein